MFSLRVWLINYCCRNIFIETEWDLRQINRFSPLLLRLPTSILFSFLSSLPLFAIASSFLSCANRMRDTRTFLQRGSINLRRRSPGRAESNQLMWHYSTVQDPSASYRALHRLHRMNIGCFSGSESDDSLSLAACLLLLTAIVGWKTTGASRSWTTLAIRSPQTATAVCPFETLARQTPGSFGATRRTDTGSQSP